MPSITEWGRLEHRAADAEQRAAKAEKRIAELVRQHAREKESLQVHYRDRTEGIRSDLAHAWEELRAAQGRIAGLEEALEREQAAHASLLASLQVKPEQPLVTVRWLKDSPPEGCHVGGHVYRGRGPVVGRKPLLIDGHLREGQHATQVERAGEVMQLGADDARVLRQAGFVAVLTEPLPLLPGQDQPWPTTAEGLKGLATSLLLRADVLEHGQVPLPASGFLTNEELLRRDREAQDRAKQEAEQVEAGAGSST